MLRKRNNRWYNYFYFHSKSQEIYKTTTKIDELNTRFMVNVQKSIVFYPQVADKKNMKFNNNNTNNTWEFRISFSFAVLETLSHLSLDSPAKPNLRIIYCPVKESKRIRMLAPNS